MASKKITELPLITGISGSVGYGTLDYRSVIPVVVGGSTNQITVEDFSIYAVRHSATTQSNTFIGNQTITGNISVSGTSTLTGNTSVGGTFGVTGNTSLSGDASVGGNLVVAGRITAEEFHTEITTASVIYASGSTKFGDTIDDKHEITGSTDISGSLTVRGNVLLNGTTFDISQLNAYTQSLKNEVGTIEAYTASVKETISQTLTYTQSLKETISQTLAYTASVKETISQTLAYTASVKNQLSGIEAYTASLKGAVLPNGTNLDVFGNLRVSGSTYFGDNASDSTIITGKVEVTGSVSSTGGNTADFIQLSLTPSGVSGTGKLIWDSNTGGVIVGGNLTANGFTGSFKSTNGAISASAQITELPSIQQATASLAAFTGSIRAELGNVEAYTASVKETISQTLAYTQSLKETISQTLAYTASVKAEIGNIESYTASLKETISQTLAYTASVKNEVGGLEAFTASIRTELGNVEAYTASVKETISQTLAYTASIRAEIGNIEAYTASLKNAIVVNGTNVEVLGTLSAQQIHTTYTTSSVLYQSGSTKFGDTNDDTHQFTGSVDVSSNIVGRANIQANKFVFTDGIVSETTTTQKVIGTSGNILYLYTGASGLYINNQANNAQNVTITDAGVVTTRGGVQIGSSGNDQNLTFGGTNSSIYWGTGGTARMYYNVGDIKISSAGASDVLTVQNIGGVSVSGGITGSLLSTNGVVSSSQQIQNYNTFALTSSINTFYGNQTISGSLHVRDGVTGSFKGNLDGTATYAGTVSILNSSTNANYAMLFTTAGSNGYLTAYTDAFGGVLYNPSINKLTVSGSIEVSGSIIPNVANGSYTSSFSLGSSTNAWGDIWVGNGSVKFVNPSSGATASIALDANNQLSLQNSSFTQGLKVTGSADITGSLTTTNFTVSSYGASGIVMNPDNADSNNSSRLFFTRTGGSGWGIFNNSTVLSFRSGSIPGNTSGTEIVRFAETGDVTLQKGNLVVGVAGNGIDFSTTSNGTGTMTSELLNDYEEGTWTPTIRGANTAGTYELTHVSHYTKIGRQVTITSRINMAGSITGGGVGYMQIQGLPFAKGENVYAIGACDVIGCDTTGNYLTVQFISLGAGSTLFLSETNDNAASTDFPISGLSASDSIGIGITYFV